MDTRIYVISHKEYDEPKENSYISLAVGKALNPALPYIGDDTGDNISKKNKTFCELTGIYWIWKNVKCDIVGICHYRRYFVKDDKLLTKEDTEALLENYDILVAGEGATGNRNLRDNYSRVHHAGDMEICRQVIEERHPECLSAFDLCMNCNFMTPFNMLITRKETFDSYCEWLFDILFEVEKRTDVSGYDEYQARLYGYLSERLLRVWLLAQTLRVKSVEVRMTSVGELEEKSRVPELKRRYVQTLISDLVTLYRAGQFFDVDTIQPMQIDTEGKIPVWVCDFERQEQETEAWQLRTEDIMNRFGKDKKVIAITYENVGRYITLPAWIIEKFNSRIISPKQLSVIVQINLLYCYGGIYRTDKTLLRFVLNALYLYWYQTDTLIDEKLTDYIISIARDNGI